MHSATIRYLYDLQLFGMKLGLKNISALLRSLDDPHRKYPAVHIAGTNGKGSTAAFLASILTASGYRVGLYTSPHLVRFHERIRVNGRMIDDTLLAELTGCVRPDVDRLHATFFEATTAIAFLHFARENVDIAVLETGLGGRLDATNVVRPMMSVITSVGLEHTEHLGRTIRRVAAEKAGIIKRRVDVLTALEPGPALEKVRQRARQMSSRLFPLAPVGGRTVLHDFDRMTFPCRIEPGGTKRLVSQMTGYHQVFNARLAVMAALRLRKKGWTRITASTIRKGIHGVRDLGGLRGRLERVSTNPEIIVDVAHNPDGFRAMLHSYAAIRRCDETDLVVGLLARKDYRGIAREIAVHSWRSIICSAPSVTEALDPAILAAELRASGHQVRVVRRLSAAVAAASNRQAKGDTLLVTGSHYVVGEYLASIERQSNRTGARPTR